MIVKILKLLLGKSVVKLINKHINRDLPSPFTWLTPWLFLVLGAALTVAVQSSSITLSTLTPLCGLGIVELERAYSMNVGADIGTTATSLIAALASTGSGFINSIQVSLAHLFFNLFGILLFFAVPVTRKLPVGLAIFVGKRTQRYRWFAVAYIITMFLLLPIVALGLALASEIALYVVFITLLVILIFVGIINGLRKTRFNNRLPEKLKSWKWLPRPMRSLEPYDSLICSRCNCCSKCCPTKTDSIKEDHSQVNPGFDEIAEDSFDQTVEDSFDITETNHDKWSTHSL